MPTEIEVVNRALIKIGEYPIENNIPASGKLVDLNISTTSTVAERVAAAIYDQIRDIVIEDGTWTFAQRRSSANNNDQLSAASLIGDFEDQYVENYNARFTSGTQGWEIYDVTDGNAATPDPGNPNDGYEVFADDATVAYYKWWAVDQFPESTQTQIPLVSLNCVPGQEFEDDETRLVDSFYSARSGLVQYVEASNYENFQLTLTQWSMAPNGATAGEYGVEVRLGTTPYAYDIDRTTQNSAAYAADPDTVAAQTLDWEIQPDGPFYVTVLPFGGAFTSGDPDIITPFNVSVGNIIITRELENAPNVWQVPQNAINVQRVWQDRRAQIQHIWRREGAYLVVEDADSFEFDYIARVENLDRWSPKAVDCLVVRLAADFATSIAQNARMQQAFLSEYEKRLIDAKAIDGQQARSERFRSRALTRVRSYGGYTIYTQ